MFAPIADAHYRDKVALAMAFAELLNDEASELAKIGVDVIQFDEPAFNVYMKEVTEWGIMALHRASEGLPCKTAVHICYGYGIKANIDWKESLAFSDCRRNVWFCEVHATQAGLDPSLDPNAPRRDEMRRYETGAHLPLSSWKKPRLDTGGDGT